MIAGMLMEGAPQRKKLDAIREQIAALKAEEKAISKLLKGVDEIEAQARADIAKLWRNSSEVSLRVRGRASEGDGIEQAMERFARYIVARFGEEEAVAFQVQQEIAELRAAGREPGPSRAERDKQLAALAEKRQALERREEEAILGLEAEGWTVLRRRDVDGALVLRVWYETFGKQAA